MQILETYEDTLLNLHVSSIYIRLKYLHIHYLPLLDIMITMWNGAGGGAPDLF